MSCTVVMTHPVVCFGIKPKGLDVLRAGKGREPGGKSEGPDWKNEWEVKE